MQQLSKRALLAGGAALALGAGTGGGPATADLHSQHRGALRRRRRVRHQLAGRHHPRVEEINAKGGILGRRINTPHLDTQSDASIARAQVQKVMDDKPYVILGPVFSGSVS